jgi:hypothetical protein
VSTRAATGAPAPSGQRIVLRFDQDLVAATLVDTTAAREFADLLQLTLDLHDPIGQAKSGRLPAPIDTADAMTVIDPDADGRVTVLCPGTGAPPTAPWLMCVLSLEGLEHSAMKYIVSIEIALPRERVAQLLADPTYLPQWLRGLVLHEPLNGVHGQVGTQSRVVMKMGQQDMALTETITRREPANLQGIPRNSVVHFDREIVTEGMWSAARERLTEAGPETTLWESENEYRFSGLPMRLMSPFMRGAFRKQSLQHMQDFKAFAEQGTDVREGKS